MTRSSDDNLLFVTLIIFVISSQHSLFIELHWHYYVFDPFKKKSKAKKKVVNSCT